ncbi:TetR/AcrR family transcriptional regulator [Mycobacterium aquaticum]|uniref:HTH tetR-type domain-containing protein n=1 Tax=Mycobacterium aquaticum TaxID=1927124 RepID=A0A1X0AWW9_9MYCO|nr:TetR/AcrR family transcriptional regulator [Mycobacterium aquaticum]ORA34499.1 hypothetical protein BST13_17350 [Mycobacterium aquaticum]
MKRQRQTETAPADHQSPSASRGRPKDHRRRDAVLAATRDILAARGYDDLTLAEAARVAGVSRPFVYDNWGTKFALVEDAIFTAAEHSPQITDDMPIAEAMRELITAMVRVQSDPAYLVGVPGLSAELYKRSDLVDQIEQKYIAPVRAIYIRVIERGKTEGVVRRETDGSALMDTVRGAVMLHTLVNPKLSPTTLIDHLCGLILGGILER